MHAESGVTEMENSVDTASLNDIALPQLGQIFIEQIS